VESIKRIFVVSFAAVISVLTTTLILAFQISMVTGSYLSGLHHIFIHSVGRRTHGSSSDFPLAFSESLNAGTVEVLEKYLKGTVIDFNTVFCTSCYFENTFSSLKMTYSCVIILLILSSILIVISRYYFSEGILYEILGKDARVFALLVAAWFSLAAPMSWFTIFKAHSYQHLHMNYIAWHMPFTLFSFAVFGKIAQCFVHRLWQINRKWYLT
jgi:hypothetical protein